LSNDTQDHEEDENRPAYPSPLKILLGIYVYALGLPSWLKQGIALIFMTF